MFALLVSLLNRVPSEFRYSETALAPNRNLRWEGGEVEGVCIIAFEAASTGSVSDPLFCRWRVLLPLLLMLAL